MTRRTTWFGMGCIAVLCACAPVADEPWPAEPALALQREALSAARCDTLKLDVDRSLVVHDAATLAAADFSLKRTLEAIANSSGGAAVTPEQLLASLLDSFTLDSHTNPHSGLSMPLDPRPAEAALDPAQLLDPASNDFMRPVALFNRLDLAPVSGVTCGEHRIVYAKKAAGGGRFFLIFEAALPNPTPADGIAGCRPVADFWAQLSEAGPSDDVATRAKALAEFYYDGLPGFAPVVQHAHYGVPFGQVRSNHFVGGPWQLREWRTSLDALGRATFVVDTTKQTPLAEFYDAKFSPSAASPLKSALFDAERASFQRDFVEHQISMLAAPELSPATDTQADLINGFGSAFPARFDDVQSDTAGDVPSRRADAALLASVVAAAPAGVSATQLLNRAGAMSCGGCHQFSNGADIGTLDGVKVAWPSSLGFVHVDERGNLSQALREFFLPSRLKVLEDFACAKEPPRVSATRCSLAPALCQPLRVRPPLILPRVPILPDPPPLLVRVPQPPVPPVLRTPLPSNAAILRARQIEQAMPGAFVAVRRVH